MLPPGVPSAAVHTWSPAFIAELVERSTARIVGPGPNYLAILERLCRDAGATGKLVATPTTQQWR